MSGFGRSLVNIRGLVFLVVVVCLFGSAAFGQPWDGNGVEGDPYQIWDANDMQAIGADANYWRAHFKLMADIDLSDYNGLGGNPPFNFIWSFPGVFDGNGHTVSNFTYSTGGGNVGLFGYINTDIGCIRDLGLIDPNVTVIGVNNKVGALVGWLKKGTISGCYVEGGNVIGDYSVGGLVGDNWNGIISDCYSSCSVVEYHDGMGHDNAGGLVANNGGKIYNCYSTGSVSGTQFGVSLGGLVGDNSGSVLNSFWDIQTSGRSTSEGGTGLQTAQMQDPNTFLNAGWDFVGEYGNGPSDIWAGPTGGGYMVLWFQLSPLPPVPSFSGGTGGQNTPYLISNAADLDKIGYNPRLMNDHFRLTDDVDLTGVEFFTIGELGHPFSGVFDGDGHRISNFSCDSNRVDCVGFFRCVDGPSAEVKDLGLINPNIEAGTGDNVGSLVGWIHEGVVTGCWCDGGTVTGTDSIGGLIGFGYHASVFNSHSTASVSGRANLGGLVGVNLGGDISGSYSSCSVSGGGGAGGLVGIHVLGNISNSHSSGTVLADTYWQTGGLVGRNSEGTITNSYSLATVTGANVTGGLVGANEEGNITNSYSRGSVEGDVDVGGFVGDNVSSSTITHCYSTGAVTGTSNTGGFVGWNTATVSASFWDVNSSDCNSSAGGTGKTTAEMQMESTFTDAGWDFVGEVINGPNDIWDICEGTNYPKFVWQIPAADFVCPDGVDWFDLGMMCEDWLLEELSADVGPDGGDGFVNFLDWAIFADGWQTTHDIFDLAEFADQWLKTGSNYLIADIAPAPDGDGVVNMVDYTLLAENWMEGH